MDAAEAIILSCNAAVLCGGLLGLVTKHFQRTGPNDFSDDMDMFPAISISVQSLYVSQDTIDLLNSVREGEMHKSPVFQQMLGSAYKICQNQAELHNCIELTESKRSPVQRIAVAIYAGH